MHAQTIHLCIDAGLAAILTQNIPVYRSRIKVLVEHACPIILHGPEERFLKILMLLPPAVFPRLQIFAYEPECHRVNGNEPDFPALAVDAEMHDAFTALQVLEPQ